MTLFTRLHESFLRHADRTAFFIRETYYTYRDLTDRVAAIQAGMQNASPAGSSPIGIPPAGTQSIPIQPIGPHPIGIITNDDLDTYAAIIAVWLLGGSYTPIDPDTPEIRQLDMLQQAQVNTIFDSKRAVKYPGFSYIVPKTVSLSPAAISWDDTSIAYTLFTSGSTGTPKGVPVTRANLSAFVEAFEALDIDLTEEDRCLQMFDLGFDLSIMSFLIPLLNGACVYTIPKEQIKYNYIFTLLDEYQLTFTLMVPSVIRYLQPWFDEIDCPSLKYSLFCGEALPVETTRQWANCVPNADIWNVYGPSEATIFCTAYKYRRDHPNKAINGVLAIGQPMRNTTTMIVSNQRTRTAAPPHTPGELCLSGPQVIPMYLGAPGAAQKAFFVGHDNDMPTRFYRTGDRCLIDEEGDILFLGRADAQVKIQGYRIELSEVEFHAKAYQPNISLVALAGNGRNDHKEIVLVIEGSPFDTAPLDKFLAARLPQYMIPARIQFEEQFPLNRNGKIDRNQLVKKLLPK